MKFTKLLERASLVKLEGRCGSSECWMTVTVQLLLTQKLEAKRYVVERGNTRGRANPHRSAYSGRVRLAHHVQFVRRIKEVSMEAV